MNSFRTLPLIALALALPWVPVARADDPPKEKPPPILDGTATPTIFETHFARYGFEPLKTIRREGPWLRITLPGDVKDIGQTGLYSYVALAGDFEAEVSYSWVAIPDPKKGYGMSCGLAVDCKDDKGFVALARSFDKKQKEDGYRITLGRPIDGQMKYDTSPPYRNIARFVKKGRLVVRREKDELVCLATSTENVLEELKRIPFTAGTVREVRLFGDAGGSETELDVWLGKFHVRAEEITGGFPIRERPGGLLSWWMLPALFMAIAAGGWWLARRRAQKQ